MIVWSTQLSLLFDSFVFHMERAAGATAAQRHAFEAYQGKMRRLGRAELEMYVAEKQLATDVVFQAKQGNLHKCPELACEQEHKTLQDLEDHADDEHDYDVCEYCYVDFDKGLHRTDPWCNDCLKEAYGGKFPRTVDEVLTAEWKGFPLSGKATERKVDAAVGSNGLLACQQSGCMFATTNAEALMNHALIHLQQ
jgi:hypothetical protein